LKGVALLKNLAKEDGTTAEVGESLDFKVTGVLERRETYCSFPCSRLGRRKKNPKLKRKRSLLK
jgi:small subunit ribosomal protein S1